MKMGRLIVVLFLIVVGVGCEDKKGVSEKTGSMQEPKCDPHVMRWEPAGPQENPKFDVQPGQSIFVFGAPKDMRAKIVVSTERQQVVPLNELRDGKETLWYGVADKECWSKCPDGGAGITCVKCSINTAGNPQLSEPCCLSVCSEAQPSPGPVDR